MSDKNYNRLRYILVAIFTLATLCVTAAETTIDDLQGEDREQFLKFRHLFLNGTSEEFYEYTAVYGNTLREKGYNMLYYKLKNNEGFFALRHNQVFQAIEMAKNLESIITTDGATQFYYLPLGLMGDIFYSCHDTQKAETYFKEALKQVGDTDPKFTMRTYQSLAEMLTMRRSDEAIEWADKAILLARSTNNVEYLSLSLAMKAYIYFLIEDEEGFSQNYKDYTDLRSQDNPDFNHRYDNVMEVARLAFSGRYEESLHKLRQGGLSVDSSLVAMNVYTMAGYYDQGFIAMKQHYVVMDSIYSLAQSANFEQIVTERDLLRSREEAQASKDRVRNLSSILVGLVVIFLIAYIMGRRKLILKIREQNRDLKVALAKAEESDRMKSAFIGNVSHEIRTPLNAIAGFSGIVCSSEYELSEEERTDLKGRIAENVEMITSIINELLELSKNESENGYHKKEEEMLPMACNQTCQSVLSAVAANTPSAVEQKFTTNVDDHFTVLTDAATVRRILTHLIDNAQKFTAKGFIELAVNYAPAQHTVTLSVTDSGIGIPEEDRKRIFDVFTKVNTFKSGIGLGLPICRRLAECIGGSVTLDETYSAGSRFNLTLPAK